MVPVENGTMTLLLYNDAVHVADVATVMILDDRHHHVGDDAVVPLSKMICHWTLYPLVLFSL
jgi:hypothetical protein